VGVRVAVVAGLLLVAAGVAAVLSGPATTFLSASSGYVDPRYGVVIPARQAACQPAVEVPGGAVSVRLIVSTAGRPGPSLTVTARLPSGAVVVRGTAPRGYRDATVEVPLSRRPVHDATATFCVRNPGPAQVAILGPYASRASAARATPSGQFASESMRLEWHRSRPGSRFENLGEIARRAGLSKASFIGSWALWVVFALILGAGALGVSASVRGTRR
jgi:hypothetical protein